MSHHAQPDPQNPPSYIEEYALPCVKPDETALVVWLHYEKDNSRDYGHIGQHPSHVIGESRTRAGDYGRGCGPPAARWAHGRTIGNLCATHIAKRH
jgi:hypothetical protein